MAAAVGPDDLPRSPWWLALRVLDEPGAVFRELAVRPRALIPIILYLVVALGTIGGMPAGVMRSATAAHTGWPEYVNPCPNTPT